MASVESRPLRKPPSLRTLWAIAKSKELCMRDEDLRTLAYRECGKESLRALTPPEIAQLAGVLQVLKDGGTPSLGKRRTDLDGNPETLAQRRKIYVLCGHLGWNNDNRRINGFVRRMFGAERMEWLTVYQCSKLIDVLKEMVERQGKAHETPHRE